MSTRRLRFALVAVSICLPFVVLALIEGVASFGLFVISMRDSHVAEERFTERDTLLGWVNAPNANRPNFFGPGLDLHINSQRFRHTGDLAAHPPAGEQRLVCSGDSFTLGYGVSDNETWCARLGAGTPPIETVNMGQAGYGIDQAYLWYIRDGLTLNPQLHIFAFITDDFRRMGLSRFAGFPKPRLSLDGGQVHAIGVPVPNPGFGPFMDRLLTSVRSLRTFELLQRYSGGGGALPPSRDSATWVIARAALRDMALRDSTAGTKLIVVLLPTVDDYKTNTAGKWARWATDAASADHYQFVNLADDLRHVAPDSVDRLFIPRGKIAFRAAAGHYTAEGNAWVDAALRAHIPAFQPHAK